MGAESINLSALSEHRKILKMWLGVIITGLLIFLGSLVLSFFTLTMSSGAREVVRHRGMEQALGVIELGAVVLSALAYIRYLTVKNKYHERVFEQFVVDNGWKVRKQYGMNEVASVLLGVGESYEQGYGFEGEYAGRPFNCLIFDYMMSDSKAKRYICLSFKLSKAYPMIVIDNKLNDHRLTHNSNLPNHIPKGVKLSLEGDFDRYFQVSTTKGNESKTLHVLSPDFMEVLEDHAGKKVDIEIGGKNLFLIYEADHYSEQSITSIFDIAYAVLRKLDGLSRTWLASGKDEEKVIAEETDATRRTMIFKTDWVGIVASVVIFIMFVILMISHVQTEPACTLSAPCYPAPVYTGRLLEFVT